MKNKIMFLIVSLLVYGTFLYSQTSNSIPSVYIGKDSVLDHFKNQLKIYPQEKIHLHLDRDYYVPGERIWFKAYLANAMTHQPSFLSRYVYVELINLSNELIDRIMLRPEDNMHYGHIFLSTVIPEGYYTVRAYSSYSNTQEDDYFFMKHIYIGKILEQKATTSNPVKRKVLNDFDVSFFPEGGNLLEGELCKVAFKALDSEGNSINIYGNIIDDDGKNIHSLETIHDGMGIFGFIPEKEKKYVAVCYDGKGNKKRFSLPLSLPHAYSLSVGYNRNDQLIVKRLKSAKIKNIPPMYILLHCRGELLYFSHWDDSKDFITFQKEAFPSGIIQILLFDEQMNPLSERLVFCQNNDQAQLSFSTDKEFYDKRDKVTTDLTVTDKGGLPVSAHLSISITDEKDYMNDHSVSILSTLLLSSELKGYIKNPAYYLNNNSENTKKLTDCLMLTHGWRRYNVPEVVKGNIKKPNPSIENNLAFSGKVTSFVSKRPFKDSSVSIITMNTGESSETQIAPDGHFVFEPLEFPENTKFFFQTNASKDCSDVELQIDEVNLPELLALPTNTYSIDTIPSNQKETIRQTGTFNAKAMERYKYDDEMRIVHLQDVVVTGRHKRKGAEPISFASKFADYSLSLTEIEERKPATIFDILVGISGIGLKQMPGGPNDIQVDLAVFIDNVYMSPEMGSPFDMLNVHDIAQIEVYKYGQAAALYGMLGAGGVISIKTKGTMLMSETDKDTPCQKVMTPLGYQKPVEFYSPRYETKEEISEIKQDLRTTIFWKPDMVISSEGKNSFEFYTSDFSTTYSVVIEGLTADGGIIHEVKQITVK